MRNPERSVKKSAPALLSGFEVGVTLPELGNTIFKPRIVKLQKKEEQEWLVLLECKFRNSKITAFHCGDVT